MNETKLEQDAAEALKVLAAATDLALKKIADAQALSEGRAEGRAAGDVAAPLTLSDHDVLNRLVQSVEDFHNETRRTLNEIKNDFKGKLSDHEMRIGRLETTNTKQHAMLWIVLVVGGFLSALLIYHVAGVKL